MGAVDSFVKLLLALVGPMVAKVLLSLGLSVAVGVGVDVALGSIKTLLVARLSQGPAAAIELAGLIGCWEALSLVLGAVTFAVTMWAFRKSTAFIGSAG